MAQGVPAQQNPGVLRPDTRPMLPSDQSVNEKPMDEVRLDLPERTGPDRVESPSFYVSKISVQGASLFKPEELQAIVAPHENREQTLNDLNSVAEAITRLYHEKGYLTAQAFIPPQDIENGALTIQVQEGTLGGVEIEGNKYYRAHIIERALSQKPGELLNIRTLEQDLNANNRRNEGYKLKAVLAAGDEPGSTRLKLQVAERLPFQITPTFDNQGRPFIGMNRVGLELRNDSLNGYGDRLSVRLLGGTGTRVMAGSYYVPVNKYGTEVGVNTSYSSVDIDLGIENQPSITGKAYSYGIGMIQPLNKDRSLTFDMGANWRSVRSYFETDETDDTQIRSLEAGLNFNKFDKWGRTFNRVQGSVGVGVLNANAKFFKLENYFTRIITLPKRNMLIVRGYAQVTPDGLPAAEQFQIGGAHSVRGFTEGVLIGDRGYNFSLEHRFPVPGLKYVSPWLDQRIQGAWFYDLGRVWTDRSNKNFIAGISDTTQRTLLQSVGVGLRAQLTRFLQGFVDVGFGLGDRHEIEPLGQPTARLHFGVRSDLMATDYGMRGNRIVPLTPRHVSVKP